MAPFDCSGCGKCCRSFGDFIIIERQLTDRDYFCRYGITGELFQVHVQPEFAEEIGDEYEESGSGKNPAGKKGCRFLCRNTDGKGFSCAVYPTRPRVCREFLCYRMLIREAASGEVRGKVIGAGELRTHDEILSTIWNNEIAPLPHPGAPGHDPAYGSGQNQRQAGDREWEAKVIAILASHGYRGDPVE